MTDRLIHRDQFRLIWEAEKVPESVIERAVERYEFLRGFPINDNLGINAGFTTRGLGSALRHAYLAPRDLAFAFVGGIGGAIIITWRDLF